MKKTLLTSAIIAFVSMAAVSQQRLVLLEHFTQASCGPCASQNPALKAVLDANQGKVIAIKYQTSWPGTDPMNAANPADAQTRVTYYNVSGVPSSRLDGNVYSGAPSGVTNTVVNNRYGVTSPTDVKIKYRVIDNAAPINDSMALEVKVRAISAIPAGRKLHTVAIERVIEFPTPPGSNGEKKFEYVMKKMFPDGNGTNLPAMAAGDSLTYNFKWSLVRSNGSQAYYDLGQASAVAFVQNNTTKEVNGAGYDAPRPWLSVEMAPGIKPVKVKSDAEQSFTFLAVSKSNQNQTFQFKKVLTGLPAGWTTSVEILGNNITTDTGSFPISANSTIPVIVKLNGPNAGNQNKKINIRIDVNSKEILPGSLKSVKFTAVTPSNVMLLDLPGTALTRFTGVLSAFSQANVALSPEEVAGLDTSGFNVNNIKKIIYSTGGAFSSTLPAERATVFMNYLNSGGKMLVVGQDIGYDLSGSGASPEAEAFFADYMGAEYISDGTTAAIVAQANPEDSLISPFMYSTISLSGTDSYPEQLSVSGTAPNAKTFLKYANDNSAAILNSGPNWKVAFVGFRMEAFGTTGTGATLRNSIFGRILGWLDGNSSIVATPTTNGPLSFCQGSSVTLTSAPGNSYLWNTGVTTPSITVNNTGTFYVQVTTPNGSNLSQALIVTRNSNPTVGTQPLSITKTYGENATFSVSSPTQNVSFQWQVNLGAGFVNISNGGQYAGVTTSTLTISSVTVDNNSNQFRCILTTIEGCTAQSSNAVLTTLSPTSVSDLIGTTPEAYPNPTSSILFVPVNGKVVRVILSDITGKEVMDKLCPVGQSQIEMKVSTLKAGVYLLQTESKEGKSPIQKIVIQ
jgi:hypothetical protein